MERLFTYGTLQDPAVQQRLLGRVANMRADTLLDFKKVQIEINGSYYFIAVKSKGTRLSGKVLAVTKEEIIRMDEYETDAYRRVKTRLESGLVAWLYC